jgi:hypothetical protein
LQVPPVCGGTVPANATGNMEPSLQEDEFFRDQTLPGFHFGHLLLRQLGTFEIQVWLNDLAEHYSHRVSRHWTPWVRRDRGRSGNRGYRSALDPSPTSRTIENPDGLRIKSTFRLKFRINTVADGINVEWFNPSEALPVVKALQGHLEQARFGHERWQEAAGMRELQSLDHAEDVIRRF